MHVLLILPALAIAFVAAAARSEPAGRVVVDAGPAMVTIAPLPDDLRLVSLPSLQYALRIEPRCAAEMRAESILVSIADTRKRLDEKDIDGQRQIEVELILPQQQIAPVAIQEFCRASSVHGSADRVLRINDVFTAQLSLRCAGEDFRSIVYAAQPLDVELQCEIDIAQSAPDDQDTSSDSPPR